MSHGERPARNKEVRDHAGIETFRRLFCLPRLNDGIDPTAAVVDDVKTNTFRPQAGSHLDIRSGRDKNASRMVMDDHFPSLGFGNHGGNRFIVAPGEGPDLGDKTFSVELPHEKDLVTAGTINLVHNKFPGVKGYSVIRLPARAF